MYRLSAATLCLVYSLSATASSNRPGALAPLEPLLDRLAEHQTRVDVFLGEASLVTTTTNREVDARGRPVHVIEVVTRTRQVEGEEQVALVRVREDGVDRTDDYRRRGEIPDGRSDGGSQINLGSPFSEALRRRYRFGPVSPVSAERPHLIRISFAPRETAAQGLLIGEAVVDVSRGEPLSITARPAVLPTLATRVDMKLEYGLRSPVGPLLSRVEADGEGGLLFIRKRVLSTTTYAVERDR